MPIPIESIMSVLTPILALYGAVLSTIIYIKEIRSKRVQVFVTHGWSYGLTAEGMEDSPKSLELSAVNACRQDVVVSSLTLDIPGFCRISPQFLECDQRATVVDNLSSVIRRPDFTQRKKTHQILKPGHQLEASFDHSQLVEVLRSRGMAMPLRVRAVFEDTLENFFFSSWFHIGDH